MDSHTTSRDSVNGSSKEYQLIKAYCARRQKQSGLKYQGNMSVGSNGLLEKRCFFKRAKVVAIKDESAQGAEATAHMMGYSQSLTFSSTAHASETEEGSTLSGLVSKLSEIADSVQIPEDAEKKGPEDLDDVIKKLVDLLRTTGDKLNEEITQNKTLQAQLQSSFNYTMFEKVTSTLQGMVGSSQSLLSLQKKKIAWAFEVTSRLSAVDLIPMSRSMGYGERYVQLHHSAWVQQNGGWEKAFEDNSDLD